MRSIPVILLLIALVFSGPNILTAQWVQTKGPEGGYVESITEDDLYLFAATRGPIYRMLKNDSIWAPHIPSLTWALSAYSLANIGNTIVAGGSFHVWRSTDHGLIFQSMESGLDNVGGVFSFAVNGNDLFAGTGRGVHLSTDHGANWSPANVGLDSLPVSCLLVKDSILVAGTWGSGVYRSTDYGTSWAPANNGMTANHINSLAILDTIIFAGTWWGDGIYRSTDEGMTWDTVNYKYWDTDVNTLLVLDTNLFAATHHGVLISVDHGDTWTLMDNGPPNIVDCFHISGPDIFAGTYHGIYVSSDTGQSWSSINAGLITTTINVLACKDSFLFAGTETGGLYRSADEGDTWVQSGLRMSKTPINSLAVTDQYIFSGTTRGVYRSSNNGDTWISVNLGLPGEGWTTSLAVSGSNLFAGTNNDGVFRSTNGGASWIPVNSGLTDMAIRSLAFSDTNLFAGTENGAYLSTNYGTSWTTLNIGQPGTAINSFAHNDEFFFAETDGDELFRSADNGATWVKTNLPSNHDLVSLAAHGSDIFAGCDRGVVFRSSNNGATWTKVDLGLIKNCPVLTLSIGDTNLFAGTIGSGVWRRPLSEMKTSDRYDFAPDDTVCYGEIIPPLHATGDSIKWHSNPDYTGLLHSGNTYETGRIEPGIFTYYVTQLLNSIPLEDTATLIISPKPVIDSINKTNESGCATIDGTITITASDEYPLTFSIDGGNTYMENEGAFTGLDNGNYLIAVKNSMGCITTGNNIEIISEGDIPAAPLTSNDTIYCLHEQKANITARASAEGTITWYDDPGLTNLLDTGNQYDLTGISSTTNFYVTETVGDCESPSSQVLVEIKNATPYEDEEICIVTADLSTGKNSIVWEKTPDVGTAYFNIYRDNNQTLIGTVPFDDLSVFRDTLVDPETRPYLYFLSVIDSCGNESELSPYHKPLFLQYVGAVDGVNLQWDKYGVEGSSIGFLSYTVLRGTSLGSFSELATGIPSPISVYTDKDVQATTKKFYYRVAGLLETSCNPGDKKTGTGPFVHSLSNLDDNKLKETGMTIPDVPGLLIYPNPFSHSTSIRFPNQSTELYSLVLTDLSGKVCRKVDDIKSSEHILKRDNLKPGLYFIEFRGPKTYRGKLVVK